MVEPHTRIAPPQVVEQFCSLTIKPATVIMWVANDRAIIAQASVYADQVDSVDRIDLKPE